MTKKLWKTKEGKEIPIKKLTDSHLINIINYFNKNIEVYRQRWLSNAYSFSATLNGEMAIDSVEREIELVEGDFPESDPDQFLDSMVPGWLDIIKEARKRNILEKTNYYDYC